MKLLIASDIHGSAYYCQKLIDCFCIENADKLVLLGDVLYHGPRNDLPRDYSPKRVIDMLNGISEKIFCVRGNCDTEVDQMVLNFPILTDYSFSLIGERSVYFTHGHHLDSLLPLVGKSSPVIFYGHTHIPDFSIRDGCTVINPGSVSIPKGESVNGYIIFDGKTVTFKSLSSESYKIERI